MGISVGSSDAEVRDNVVSGGVSGIVVTSGGSPSLIGNTIEDASGRGVAIGRGTSPALQDNRICGNATNLFVDEGADPLIDDTNEICEDLAAG
jgi:parallel beta-helix repeat protein